MTDPFPELVLADTLWDFAGQAEYASRPAFEEAVGRYHAGVQEYAPEIRPEENWQPGAIVLRAPRVIVHYFSDSGIDEESWHEVELVSDDTVGFRGGELLFKLHNAAIGQLRNNAHRWFEGLELSAITAEGAPVYDLRLGS
jgi:hypothetical protein